MNNRFLPKNRKIIVYAGFSLFIAAGATATPAVADYGWKNLKVIPKSTNPNQLERVMTRFDKSLGVTCSYCHPDTKPDIFPRRVDFVSDELSQKRTARDMMRMTDKINKKYFNFKNDYNFDAFFKQPVDCKTCHRGLTKPYNMKLFNR
jgi:hypothetical protein